MSLQDVTNTQQLAFMQHDSYFMDLEQYVMSRVSIPIQSLAMERRKGRHHIPEWMAAVNQHMDFNQAEGPEGLARTIDKYKQWCAAGYGEEWFCDTDTDDDAMSVCTQGIEDINDTYK